MLKIPFLVICAFGLIIPNGTASKKRKRTFEKTSRFDERLEMPIASESLIRVYENEHKMMHRKEDETIDEAKYTEWPSKLGDKNLTECCEKYLNGIILRKPVFKMFGEAEPGQISYLHEGNVIKHSIGVLKCEILLSDSSKIGKIYYVTKAPEKECVYMLLRTGKGIISFKIVFKVCRFERNDPKIRPSDRKKTMLTIDKNTGIPIARNDLIAEYEYKHQQMYRRKDGSIDAVRPKDKKAFMVETHKATGIPIARNDLIADYERKHQEMYKKDDGSIDTGKYKLWPLSKHKTHLNDFCMKYLQAVVPNRLKEDGLYGEADTFELQYTENNSSILKIGIVKCYLQSGRIQPLYYYITESPEPDCVYTLLRTTTVQLCRIVYQICGIKIDESVKVGFNTNQNSSPVNPVNEWKLKPDSRNLSSVGFNNPSDDGTEEREKKLI